MPPTQTRALVRVLDVPVLRQPNGFGCGPTSLQAICWFHGKRVSNRRLSALCRLTEAGTDHAGIVRGGLAMGASVFERSGGTLSELRWFVRRGLPVVVGWWSRDPGQVHFDPDWDLATRRDNDCGHFSVCTGVGAQKVWLMDPQQRPRSPRAVGKRAMSRRQFLEAWYDTDTDDYVRVPRWYAVVHFDDRRFAARFRGGADHHPVRTAPSA